MISTQQLPNNYACQSEHFLSSEHLVFANFRAEKRVCIYPVASFRAQRVHGSITLQTGVSLGFQKTPPATHHTKPPTPSACSRCGCPGSPDGGVLGSRTGCTCMGCTVCSGVRCSSLMLHTPRNDEDTAPDGENVVQFERARLERPQTSWKFGTPLRAGSGESNIPQ